MEHDLEFCVIKGGDRKKKPERDKENSNGGKESGSLVVKDRRVLWYNHFLSVFAKRQTNRSQ